MRKIELEESLLFAAEESDSLLALDRALPKPEQSMPEHSRVVELRYCPGLPVEDAAQVLAISERTIERQWSSARAWLYREIGEGCLS